METILEDDETAQVDQTESTSTPLVVLEGVIYGRSFRGTFASLHVARHVNYLHPDSDQADPVLVRLQFKTTPQDARSALRSYCKRFFKHGDWLRISTGVWRDVDVQVDTEWRSPRLVVDLQSIEEASRVLERRQVHHWSMKQCQAWQKAFLHVFNPMLTSAASKPPPIWTDQPPADAEPSIVREGRASHGSMLAKKQQGQLLVHFLIRMMMQKLRKEDRLETADDDDDGDPSTWATDTTIDPADYTLYRRAVDTLNRGTGVVDVAGGSGHLSMALGLAGIRSTVVDPRENVGKLPHRDRKVWKQAVRARENVDDSHCGPWKLTNASISATKENDDPPYPTGKLGKMRYCQPVIQFQAHRAWFGTPPSGVDASFRHPDQMELPVCGSQSALLAQCSAIVALHPDEATDAIVDTAVARRLPFLLVPCCVFFRLFPHRRKRGSLNEPVSTYDDLLDYLGAKENSIQRVTLPFEGKNTLLWSAF